MRPTEPAPGGRDTRDEEFREFARSRASPLHQTAYLLCGDWHLAHDLVQDTLVKAYQHWPRVRRADSPDAYVRRILLNEVRGRWRRRDAMVPVARFVQEPVVADATDEVARRAGLFEALHRADMEPVADQPRPGARREAQSRSAQPKKRPSILAER